MWMRVTENPKFPSVSLREWKTISRLNAFPHDRGIPKQCANDTPEVLSGLRDRNKGLWTCTLTQVLHYTKLGLRTAGLRTFEAIAALIKS